MTLLGDMLHCRSRAAGSPFPHAPRSGITSWLIPTSNRRSLDSRVETSFRLFCLNHSVTLLFSPWGNNAPEKAGRYPFPHDSAPRFTSDYKLLAHIADTYLGPGVQSDLPVT